MSDPLDSFDGWELEEKLDHVRRILGMAAARESCGSSPSGDQPQGWLAPATATPSSPVDWALTKTAVSAITCGGILAAWWWIDERQDLIKPALASLVIGHLAWFGKWCCDANRRVHLHAGKLQA
jgi:hypothetical protein